jgi:hypothetical protein
VGVRECSVSVREPVKELNNPPSGVRLSAAQ